MEGSAVKKSYQRACLLVHPDRMGAGSEHHDLAKEIFIMLSQAFKVFEESGAKSLV